MYANNRKSSPLCSPISCLLLFSVLQTLNLWFHRGTSQGHLRERVPWSMETLHVQQGERGSFSNAAWITFLLLKVIEHFKERDCQTNREGRELRLPEAPNSAGRHPRPGLSCAGPHGVLAQRSAWQLCHFLLLT